jgi:flagellar basal body-associated protein FliL
MLLRVPQANRLRSLRRIWYSKNMEVTLNRILGITAAALAVFILAVTGISFVVKKAEPGKNLRTADPEPGAVVNMTNEGKEKLAAFTGLGRIRAVTKPDKKKSSVPGTPVVITPWFSYPDGDTEFYEELSRKSTAMKALIAQYFAQYTEKELRSAGEEKIKADLLAQLNERLSLGKISALYFSDYIFLE